MPSKVSKKTTRGGADSYQAIAAGVSAQADANAAAHAANAAYNQQYSPIANQVLSHNVSNIPGATAGGTRRKAPRARKSQKGGEGDSEAPTNWANYHLSNGSPANTATQDGGARRKAPRARKAQKGGEGESETPTNWANYHLSNGSPAGAATHGSPAQDGGARRKAPRSRKAQKGGAGTAVGLPGVQAANLVQNTPRDIQNTPGASLDTNYTPNPQQGIAMNSNNENAFHGGAKKRQAKTRKPRI